MELEMITELEFHPTDADWNVVQRLRHLCPPPEVALQVIELARDLDVDLSRLVYSSLFKLARVTGYRFTDSAAPD